MKQILFLLLLTSLSSLGQNDALDNVLETQDDFEAASTSFHEGKAQTGEEFFAGLLAEIIIADVKYREMEEADNQDASEADITLLIDECLKAIEHLRQSLALYVPERWPRQQEFSDLSLEWVMGIEGMLNDFARPLAAAMAKPDEEWSDDEYALYEKWQAAYDVFLEVDARWVAFQHTFAEENDFTLSEETIDVGAMVNPTIGLSDEQLMDQLFRDFMEGKSTSALDFYNAIWNEVMLIGAHYSTVIQLDDDGAGEFDITTAILECNFTIDVLRISLRNNDAIKWERQKEWMDLTLAWIDGVENMLDKYALPLASAMGRADNTPTSKESKLVKKWAAAYEKFIPTDNAWVSFQSVFANANGFELTDAPDNLEE